MKKILMSLTTISAMAALVIGATSAYFSDTETSTGNIFIAGTIDLGPINLQLADYTDIKPSHILEPITVTFKNVGQNEGTLEFEYSYTENDKVVDGYCDSNDPHFFEFWAGPGTDQNCLNQAQSQWEMAADDFAKLIYITASTQDGFNNLTLLTQWADINSDGKVSLYELKTKGAGKWYRMDANNQMTTDDTLGPGESTTMIITPHMGDAFDGDLSSWPAYTGGNYSIVSATPWNVPQADGIDLSLTATLKQVTTPTP